MGGSRGTRRHRSSPELHFGYNYSRGRIPNVGAAAPHPRGVYGILALSLVLVLATGVLATWGSDFDIIEVLRAALAFSRGVAFLIGFLGLPLVLVYYYSAGIDWPFEEASRLTMIGAILGLVLYALLMFMGEREGWLDLRSFRTWVAPGLLSLIAFAGYAGQRSA